MLHQWLHVSCQRHHGSQLKVRQVGRMLLGSTVFALCPWGEYHMWHQHIRYISIVDMVRQTGFAHCPLLLTRIVSHAFADVLLLEHCNGAGADVMKSHFI